MLTRSSSTERLVQSMPYPALKALAALPDPRQQASVTYPLDAMLALVLAGLLAIAEWARHQLPDTLTRLGLPAGRIPRQSTLHRLLARLDPRMLASRLDAALDEVATQPHARPVADAAGIATDGKTQRWRLVFGHSGTPVHTVTA